MRDGKHRSAGAAHGPGARAAAARPGQSNGDPEGRGGARSKKVTFAEPAGEQEDPAAYHGYEQTPNNLCALALRIASKSTLQTSVVSSFILFYCVVLCWAGPAPGAEEGAAKLQVLRITSWVCIVVWLAELAAKVAGFGFRPFLRNNWNLLDSACLISLAIDVSAVPGASFAYLRLFKVCRPLLQYSAFAQLQRTLDTIVRSCRLLPPILSLTGIFVFLCAVFGSQLFGSDRQLYNRCVKPAAPAAPGVADASRPLSAGQGAFNLVLPESHCVNQSGMPLGKYFCDANDGQVCTEMADLPPFHGIESFDNALSAAVVVVLAILQQKYDDVFEGTLDTAGDLAGLYFLFITMVGAYFLLNYTTAILAISYAKGRDGRLSKPVEHILEHAAMPDANVPTLHPAEQGGGADAAADVNSLHTTESHFVLQGVVSARQFVQRVSWLAREQYAVMRRNVQGVWRPFVRPFAVLIAYPTRVGPDADLSALKLRATPYSEILLRVSMVSHVALLASITHASSAQYMATVRAADGWFVCFFVVVEVLRVLAHAGLAAYLNRSWENIFDFLITLATFIAWLCGVSERLQLGPLRAVRLHASLWDLKAFRRTKHVLLVCAGPHGELLRACAGVLLCYMICAMLLRQTFAAVELEDQRQMFTTFPSSLISLLEMTAGDALQPLLREAHSALGSHAVLIAIAVCFFVKQVVNKILTAIVLQNLSSPDHDKICYQMQFERLSWLHGWTPGQQSYHWLHTRDHSELLEHGEQHVLVPDTAGSFERVYADTLAAKLHQGNVTVGEQSTSTQGFGDTKGEGTARGKGLSLVRRTKAWLKSWNEAVHDSMQLSATYWIRIRVVRFSNGDTNESQPSASANAAERKVRIDVGKLDHDSAAMVVLDSRTSGNPVDNAGTRWDDFLEFGPVSRDACFKMSFVDTPQGSEVLLGEARDTFRAITMSPEVVRTYVLHDPADNAAGVDTAACGDKQVDAACGDADDDFALKELFLERSDMRTATLLFLCEPDLSNSTCLARWRLKLQRILKHPTFENTIMFFIVMCIVLSIVEFESRDARDFHEVVDLVFIVVFSAEAVLKILGLGVWHDPEAYFRSGWNVFDFVVVLWMLAAFNGENGHKGSLNVYALRFFRIIRPLLKNPAFESFQISLNALLHMWTVIFLILAALTSILFAVSVCALWTFRGRIHFCNDTTVRGEFKCHGILFRSEGFLQPRVWDAPVDSFDTVADALLACFRALNRSGWRSVVEEVMFATDDNHVRSEHRVEANALPFIVVELVCNLMLFQAMQAIMINAIDVTRGHALLTTRQISFQSTVATIENARQEFVRYVQTEGIEWLQVYVLHPYFEGFTALVIMINILVLLLDSYKLGEAGQVALSAANQLFVYFYVLEQGLKMVAFSWAYFVPKINGTRWVSYVNVFDFVVTIASLLEITVLQGEVMCVFRVLLFAYVAGTAVDS